MSDDSVDDTLRSAKWLMAENVRLREENERLNNEALASFESWTSDENERLRRERNDYFAEVERLREDLQILRQARQEDYEVTRRLIGAEAEVERLRAEVGLCITEYDRLAATIQRIRDKASEWMRNESISADYQDALADAAEELLAALDGETSG